MIKYFKKMLLPNLQLQHQIDSLKEKLAEKQLHIDKTNAYWKKKMSELASKKKL